jgi:hypothetical protein
VLTGLTRAARASGSLIAIVGLAAAFVVALTVGRSSATLTGATPPPGQDEPASSSVQDSLAPTLAASCETVGSGLTSSISFDRPDPTLATETHASSAVLIATIASFGTPTWNTADGTHEPLTDHWPRDLLIYTPVTLNAIDAALDGAPEGILFLGGTIGCDRLMVEGSEFPSVGERVALFLAPSHDDRAVSDAQHLSVIAAWPVDNAGNVLTPADGIMPIATFKTSVQKLAQ